MKYPSRVVLIAFLAFSLPQAEEHVSGELGNTTFTRDRSPFVVDADVTIPAGKKVTIDSGCVFLFKAFTGLKVSGNLFVNGTQANPVIFTSINDTKVNPASEQLPSPFDWNDILIAHESTGAHFSHLELRYSVFGIKAQYPDIQIEQSKFFQNGQYHFTINDEIQEVQDNVPFSYGGATAPPDSTQRAASAAEKKKRRKTAVRVVGLGVGLAGLGAGAVFAVLANKEHQRLAEWTSNKTSYLSRNKSAEYTAGETRIKNAKKRNILLAGVTGGIGALGVVGFGLTFAF